MDDKEALQLLIKKKELGITDLELDAFKKSFNARNQVFVPDVKAEALIKPASSLDDITDEELQYFATPYYDELQAKKELQSNQRKDDEALK